MRQHHNLTWELDNLKKRLIPFFVNNFLNEFKNQPKELVKIAIYSN